MSHPNSVVTLLTTAASGLAYKVAQHYGWLSFTPEDGIIAAGAVSSLVLFVGRRGPVRTGQAVWAWIRYGADGNPKPARVANQVSTPTPPPPAVPEG